MQNKPDYLLSKGERPCYLSAVDLTYQKPCYYSYSYMYLSCPYLKSNCYPCSMNTIAFSHFDWDSSWCRGCGVPWVSQMSPEVPVSCCQAICLWHVVVFCIALSAEALFRFEMLHCTFWPSEVTFNAIAHQSNHERCHLLKLSSMSPPVKAIINASTCQRYHWCHHLMNLSLMLQADEAIAIRATQ